MSDVGVKSCRQVTAAMPTAATRMRKSACLCLNFNCGNPPVGRRKRLPHPASQDVGPARANGRKLRRGRLLPRPRNALLGGYANAAAGGFAGDTRPARGLGRRQGRRDLTGGRGLARDQRLRFVLLLLLLLLL